MKKSLVAPLLLALAGCPGPNPRGVEVPPTSGAPAALVQGQGTPVAQTKKAPSAEDAQVFLVKAEQDLLAQWIRTERAEWIKSTNITHDTTQAAAAAQEALAATITRLAQEAMRFRDTSVSADLARKFKLLRLSPPLAAPANPAGRAAVARAVVTQQAMYGKGRYCPQGKSQLRIRTKKGAKRCYDLGQLSERLGKSRNYAELEEIWRGWRQVSRPMRAHFERYVELANQGARELGFADAGALWRSRFDMNPADFEQEVDRLWLQVKPLYTQLHCYARAKLAQRYGDKKVSSTGPIPAHLLGNMWAQDWSYISDLLMPKGRRGVDLDGALKRKGVDAVKMVRYAEGFFTSLGMDKLPSSFWKRSMLTKPVGRDVVCHASAWDVDMVDDLRIKMCIKINGEDFSTIHHELGHIYYYHYYKELSPLYRDSANKGFHEGLGDTISLSVTSGYLQKVGLLASKKKVASKDAIAPLMARALEKVAFLPFGILIDKWRWDVFAGKVKSADYNKHWWKLRHHYQGIVPPTPRSAEDFDPGAKYHIAANVPYARYFLAAILQFQFHRALCKTIGHEGPLHECSIYGNKKAGARLMAMMKLGLSQPWPDALEALTGERQMDASAILGYFEPLHQWLKEQNKGRQCGWK
ncbi:MAG: M2 family metallopeptidase [Deltaproteobacteria bacterium]|nr:M2 family metallopeptidase [Deltaproteobacteria bacterium]